MTSPPLQRAIRLPHAIALVAGIIIGAAVFVQPSELSRHVPTAGGMLAAWAVAGFLTLCGAQVCAGLSAVFPQTGGVYVYLRQTISPAAGFAWGWAMFWSIHTGIIAAIAVILARYAAYFVPLGDTGIRLTAIAAVIILSAVNAGGVKPASRLQALLTAAKVVAIVIIVAVLFLFAPAGRAPAFDDPLPPLSNFVLAVAAGLFAFGGWHMVTYSAGETDAPESTIPRALLIGTLIVTACYLALNFAYLRVLPMQQILSSTRVAADAVEIVAGKAGGSAIAALVVVSCFGSLNGIILSGPRVYLAMAQDGMNIAWMSAIHPAWRTPHSAIAAQAIWAAVLIATGSYRALFTRVVYTEWLFFALMTVGLLRLRRARHPALAVLFLISCLVIVGNQIVNDPAESALGLLIVAAALPVYYLIRRKSLHADH